MISFFLVAGTANARDIEPEHFFDYEFARSIWLTKKTNEEFDPLYYCYEQDGGTFNSWMESYKRSPQQALKALEAHPDAAAIKRCYDIQLTYSAWTDVYEVWREDTYAQGSDGWNNDNPCDGMVAHYNIFTRKCDDLPDWRHPENVIMDNERIAESNARWWNQNKKAE